MCLEELTQGQGVTFHNPQSGSFLAEHLVDEVSILFYIPKVGSSNLSLQIDSEFLLQSSQVNAEWHLLPHSLHFTDFPTYSLILLF